MKEIIYGLENSQIFRSATARRSPRGFGAMTNKELHDRIQLALITTARHTLSLAQKPIESPHCRLAYIYSSIQSLENLILGAMHVPYNDEPAFPESIFCLEMYQNMADNTAKMTQMLDELPSLGENESLPESD